MILRFVLSWKIVIIKLLQVTDDRSIWRDFFESIFDLDDLKAGQYRLEDTTIGVAFIIHSLVLSHKHTVITDVSGRMKKGCLHLSPKEFLHTFFLTIE